MYRCILQNKGYVLFDNLVVGSISGGWLWWVSEVGSSGWGWLAVMGIGGSSGGGLQ